MATPSNYVLGQSDWEYQRLMMQSRLLRPWTERFFRSAGLVPGMSVLDVGSGIGDVAFLGADIVGAQGRVLGLDRDAAALEKASARAAQLGCEPWVKFQATDLLEFDTPERFDALTGRYILLYQPDAAKAIRHLCRFLRPGGIVVFHELDFTNPNSSWPPCKLWDDAYWLVAEFFRRAGAPPDFGRRVGKTFLDAGLPWPQIDVSSVAGGGPGSVLYRWIADTLRSVAPRMKSLGIDTDIALDETLEGRLREAVLAIGGQLTGPIQIGAWARTLAS
jgi:ubiquinone/menaquinone biosynthesis C-methylase UbiE